MLLPGSTRTSGECMRPGVSQDPLVHGLSYAASPDILDAWKTLARDGGQPNHLAQVNQSVT
jgi:hypothetical protein